MADSFRRKRRQLKQREAQRLAAARKSVLARPPAPSAVAPALPLAPSPEGHIRAKVLLVGAGGCALTALLVTQAEQVLAKIHVGYLQFPPASFALLLLLTGINTLWRRGAKRLGLSASDLLVIYCMMLVAAMASSHGIAEKIVPQLVAPRYFANSGNHWHALFDPHIPPRLMPYHVADPGPQAVVDDYYNKMPRGGLVPWSAWVVPLLNWGILISLVVCAFLCLAAILRRQWVDNERLAFPLAQLPLEIAQGADSGERRLFANPTTWLGILVPVVVFGVKELHQIAPAVPDIVLQFNLSDYVTTPPFSAATNWTYFIVSFAAIGFFFLLPTDVLFSLWFFFVLARLEQVIAIGRNMAIPQMPMFPVPLFVGYQTVGAYVVLAAVLFWNARKHLGRVWRAAWPGGKHAAGDGDELIPYRWAVWGLGGSVLGSALWLWLAGMSLWLAVFEMIVFVFIIAVVLARSTAEAGMLMTETTFRPIDLYRMVAPVSGLGPQNLTLLALTDSLLMRDQRGLLLTGFLDSARISEAVHVRRRAFAGALVIGLGVAVIIAVGLNIALPYHIGALQMDPYMEHGGPVTAFNDYAPYFRGGPTSAAGAGWQMPVFFAVGMAVTIFLSVMRAAFFWWPLNPLGYALAGSWATVQFWFPCLLAWALKSLTLRYGGMSAYKRVRPFFLGLVIGEFGIAVVFVLLNILFHCPVPAFPWA